MNGLVLVIPSLTFGIEPKNPDGSFFLRRIDSFFFFPSQFDKKKTLIARLAKDIEPITNTKKKEVENE
jgi:hypothetical protein